MELLEKFKSHLIANKFVQENDKILMAVSGGLDSVTLLHLFHRIQNDLNLQLCVVHVHHGIRGEEANRDLEFVQSLSAEYQMPFYFRKVDAIKHAADKHLSLEESARNLRYQIFDEILKESGCTKLAIAHTADDQAETIIDHFLRGSGISGMKGMPRSRGVYFRPLLAYSRNELEAYVIQNGLQYCIDSSNEDLKYKRNRIRNELIPYLRKYFNKNIVDTVVRFGEIFEENEDFLKTHANNTLKSLVSLHKKNEIILDIDGFLNYFDISKKYVIFKACENLSVDRNNLTFEKITRIISLIKQRKIGKKVQLDKNSDLIVDHDGIVITKRKKQIATAKLNLLEKDSLKFSDYEIRWSVIDKPRRLKFDRNNKIEFVDFDKTGSQVSLRTFLPGDKFVPLNFSGQKKVADYFSDKKVPHHLRKVTPILETDNGIVWICGYCIDDRFKVTSQTTRFLRLEIIEHANAM